jgi:hypothetical protein
MAAQKPHLNTFQTSTLVGNWSNAQYYTQALLYLVLFGHLSSILTPLDEDRSTVSELAKVKPLSSPVKQIEKLNANLLRTVLAPL